MGSILIPWFWIFYVIWRIYWSIRSAVSLGYFRGNVTGLVTGQFGARKSRQAYHTQCTAQDIWVVKHESKSTKRIKLKDILRFLRFALFLGKYTIILGNDGVVRCRR